MKWITYFSIVGSTTFKFLLGPIIGSNQHLNPLLTIFLTVLGMMISVFVIVFVGEKIKDRKKSKPKETITINKKLRFIVKTWQKFGLTGIAVLTPIILSPILGSIIAVYLEDSRWRIIKYMFISAVCWSFFLTFSFQYIQAIIVEMSSLFK